MLRSFAFRDGHIYENLSWDDIAAALRDQKTLVWIDIQNLTDSEADFLVMTFRFHPLAIEDCMGDYVRPKREDYDHHMFIVMNSLLDHHVDSKMTYVSLNCFLSSNYIVTTSTKKIHEIESLLRSPENLKKIFSNGVDYVLHAFMDRIMDKYFSALNKITEKVDRIEDRIAQDELEDIQDDIFDARKEVMSLRRNVSSQREILNYFKNIDNPYIHKNNQVYFRDIFDHASRIMDALNQNRELLNWAMDSYRSEIINKTNDVMKFLSIVATIMLPLTLVTGIYGMNFAEIPGSHNPYGFWAVVTALLVLGGGMLYLFKCKKWL